MVNNGKDQTTVIGESYCPECAMTTSDVNNAGVGIDLIYCDQCHTVKRRMLHLPH
jgi:NMD protein affecting ribosome stability and mRNA decay